MKPGEVPIDRDRTLELVGGFGRTSRIVQRPSEVLAVEEIEWVALDRAPEKLRRSARLAGRGREVPRDLEHRDVVRIEGARLGERLGGRRPIKIVLKMGGGE
jgi:hypothetical protein